MCVQDFQDHSSVELFQLYSIQIASSALAVIAFRYESLLAAE